MFVFSLKKYIIFLDEYIKSFHIEEYKIIIKFYHKIYDLERASNDKIENKDKKEN